ncbi:MAG: glycosyltransferase family 39 protein [Anaerolineae bacterium]|nr:glycosyltransferase family 39 protein [Anaerolineae bacterium]
MSERLSRWPLAALLLTLLVAAGLRLVRLPTLPVGLHYDEAANGILAAEIARGLEHPVFISAYTGKEVLFFYWAAAWMRVLGENVLALRLTSAVIGICTVGAAAWSAYELVHEERNAAWVGVLAAAFVATSFWHLVLSRYGFRAVTQPLLQALTVGALWRGLRLERRGWLVLAGLLGGATMYTYLAARAFPLPVGAALLALLLADRGRRRARAGQVALFAAAAGVAALPLLGYFAAHPAALTTRVGQIAAGSWAEAWAGFRTCLGMFFLRGDPYIRFNLPHRPLFAPPTAVLFGLGLLRILWPLRQKIRPAARLFLLAVLPAMLLPTALATGEIIPSNLRAVGLLPFVYVLPALAVESIAHVVTRRWRLAPHYPLLAASMLLLALLAPFTARAYFFDWAFSNQLYEETDGDLVAVAAYLDQAGAAGTTPYVASIHYRHPTLAFLSDDYPAIRWLTGGETLVFPAQGAGLLILPRSADSGQDWIEGRLAGAGQLAAPLGPDGQPAFAAYRVAAGEAPSPGYPLRADFGGVATLLGYDLLGTPRSGEAVDLLAYWRVEAPAEPGDMLPVARLSDPWGGVWGEARPFHYPAEQWQPGEVVLDHLAVPIAPGAPPGTYRLWFAFYAASTQDNLPLRDASGAYAGLGVELPLQVARAAAPPDLAGLPIRQRLDLPGVAGLTLLGVNLDSSAVQPGQPLQLTLFWWADSPPQVDLTMRLQLGETALYQGAPVHDTYPTSQWSGGEVVVDRYSPRLTRTAAAGCFPLQMALLDTAGNVVWGPLALGEIAVGETARIFEPPAMERNVGLPLGGQVELLGYDQSPANPAPGDALTLTLYWRALTEIETSYTVFVHLLAPQGGTAAQHDGIPAGGTYPTPLWLPGEVVADTHVLDLPPGLPPGTYPLEVGLYVVETGVRLPVPGSTDGAVILQPIDLEE